MIYNRIKSLRCICSITLKNIVFFAKYRTSLNFQIDETLIFLILINVRSCNKKVMSALQVILKTMLMTYFLAAQNLILKYNVIILLDVQGDNFVSKS
jgi:hypothetical protein